MSSSKPAPAPDYVGAAKAQGESNLSAALATGQLNNPNIVNPYGTQQVTYNAVKDAAGNTNYTPTITQKLGKAEQEQKTQSDVVKGLLNKAGISSANLINKNASSQLDFGPTLNTPESLRRMGPAAKLQNPELYRQDVIDAMMGRVNTDIGKQREAESSRLISAGIRPGTAQYNNAMDTIGRQLNDARQQAILSGGSEASRDFGMNLQGIQQKAANLTTNQNLNVSDQQMAMEARKQAIAEALTKRQQPINELSAVMSGSQLNNPFAGGLGYQAGAQVGAAPVAGAVSQQGAATQNQYNVSQAAKNANLQAGAGLIGSLGSAYLSR